MQKKQPIKRMAWICSPRIYEYDGWTFEFNRWCGPHPLKKDGELRKRAGRRFWKTFDRFMEMSREDQEKCSFGGGCAAVEMDMQRS